MMIGAGVFSVGMVGFGLSETYWLSLVLLFVSGLGFPLVVTAWITLLQTHSAPEYRGRVLAIYAITMQGISIAWILGGWLMDLIGEFPTVLVSVGGGTAIMALAMIVSRDFRRA